MIKKILKFACLAAVVMGLASCAATRKSMIYLQDMSDVEEYPVVQKYEAVIQRDNKLSITVSCKNPELALAFNMPGTGSYTIGIDGSISSTGATSAGSKPCYTVDVNGNIEFPMLGTLHVEGLTRNQLVQLITNKIVEQELLKDPIVLVEFLNFKISVLGEVNHVGNFDISGERFTLLDAIAMAGDLNDNARIDRVAVIREYGNKRRIMWNDLRSKDLFLSPSFYLQQNDVIYVEPSDRKARLDAEHRFRFWQLFLSSAMTLTTLVLYFTK